MKITINHYEKTYSIDLGTDEVVFDEFMEAVKDLSQLIYHHETIKEYWEE